MGIYAEYLDKNSEFPELNAERKKQLSRISKLRSNKDILCYAADLNSPGRETMILYGDLIPISDQLENLSGNELDVILETPGGLGVIAEDIVKMFRYKYNKVSFIIPGSAKSAGTIMTMSGDEILMSPSSSLGPIDAQMEWQGKVFSADAFLKGLDAIKDEVGDKGPLNRAYIPILGNISPGEIEHAKNLQSFSQTLVSKWLANYKFQNWEIHSSTGATVTKIQKEERASEIAEALCKQEKWLTHGRSIKIPDLEKLKLKIIDYSKIPDLNDAITRYYTLLQMTFDMSNIYKVFETPDSQIYRFRIPPGARVIPPERIGQMVLINFSCPKCKVSSKIQANQKENVPLEKGAHPFPADDIFNCPNCGAQNNLKPLRFEIESETKKRIIT